MANIYKREPIRRELPANYSDLDAVGYVNLNNFKGLQVYDNPMIAEQSSTYSGKNVYVDEHSNLTIRPALQYIKTTDRWRYTASNGTNIFVKYLDGKYILSAAYTYNNEPITVDDYIIANPNIIPIVENDILYLLVQRFEPANQLAFIRLIPGSNSFTDDYGVIFLDDQSASDISHYNILNAYTQLQLARDGDELGLIRPESLYSSIATRYLPGDVYYLSDKYTLSLHGYNADIYYCDGSIIVPTYIGLNARIKSQSSNLAEYWNNAPNTLVNLKFKNGVAEVYEISYQFEAPGSNAELYSLTDDSGIIIRIFSIDVNGVLIDEKHIDVVYTDIVDTGSYNPLIGATVFKYNWNDDRYANWLLVTVELYTPEDDTQAQPNLKIFKYNLENSALELEASSALNAIQLTSYLDSSGDSYTGLRVGHKPVAMFSASEYTCKVCILWKAFDNSKGSVKSRSMSSLYEFELTTGNFNDVSYVDDITGINGPPAPLGFFENIVPFSSDKYHGFVANNPFKAIEETGESSQIVLSLSYADVSDNTHTLRGSRYLIPELVGSYSKYRPTALTATATEEGLSLGYTDGYSSVSWVLTTEGIYNYTLPVSNGASIVYSDGKTVLSSDQITIRALALRTINISRSTANIPVLSQIYDNFVTYFFLDNIHWFIFEHTILATGVDNLGFHTIRRFDPLKYFKFTECITSAVRASDTSFWIFHGDGSYLIYKSSITLADQTSYYWLCTNAAKSKGCDFVNGVTTLPVSNNIAVVTTDDISSVALRENVATDERILIPLTLPIAANIRQLLSKTESVVIAVYKYLTIFFLNKISKDNYTPAVVFDNVSNSWWYWEFPFREIYSAKRTENSTQLSIAANDINTCIIYELTEDEYTYGINSIIYSVYADRLDASQTPAQIDWKWQSAVQLFGTVEKRKQLLFTTFIFDDYMPDETSEQTINLGYYFNIYSKEYATSEPDSTTATVYRVSNSANRTMIARFNYLQLVLHNAEFLSGNNIENGDFTALTKPKICSISLKYRILRGEWT